MMGVEASAANPAVLGVLLAAEQGEPGPFAGGVAQSIAAILAFLILLGVTFVSIGVGLSAGLRSENLVVILGFGLVVLFTLLWQVLLGVFTLILGYFEIGGQALRGDIVTFLAVLSPRQAFLIAYSALTSADQNVSAPTGSNLEQVSKAVLSDALQGRQHMPG